MLISGLILTIGRDFYLVKLLAPNQYTQETFRPKSYKYHVGELPTRLLELTYWFGVVDYMGTVLDYKVEFRMLCGNHHTH